MLEKVKTALRITHNYLDNDIIDTIATSRLEMIRAGVAIDVANSDEELIQMAIKTYCLAHYSNNEKMAEGYQKSFDLQLDNIRKSSGYSNVQ